MYGSTIGVNMFFFLMVFPMLANFSLIDASPAALDAETASLKLEVNIPCSGHATLISDELKTIHGISAVKFLLPNDFLVTYDPSKTSADEILSLSVFKEFPAKIVSS
jgi:C4-dicarboxylate transporter